MSGVTLALDCPAPTPLAPPRPHTFKPPPSPAHTSPAAGTNPTLVRILRIARVTRLLRTLRVVKSLQGLQMLLTMLVLSLPALINIAGLFLIVLAMYSLLGMQLFGTVADGELIGVEVSFCSFTASMLALFRCATGEGWNTIMHDAMYDEAKLVRRLPPPPRSHSCAASLTRPPPLACPLTRMARAAPTRAAAARGSPCPTSSPSWCSRRSSSSRCSSRCCSRTIWSRSRATRTCCRRPPRHLTLAPHPLPLPRPPHSARPDLRQAEDKDAFLEAWGKLDPLATGRLPVHQLVEMVHSMPPPLGMDPADFPFRQVSRSSVLAYLLQARLIPRPRCLPALPSAAHRTPRVALLTSSHPCWRSPLCAERPALLAPPQGRRPARGPLHAGALATPAHPFLPWLLHI